MRSSSSSKNVMDERSRDGESQRFEQDDDLKIEHQAAAKEQQSSYLENIGIGRDDGSSTEKSRSGGSKEMELHIGRGV